MKSLTQAGVVATAMIAVSLIVAWGVMAGVLGTDVPTRAMMAVNSLLLAYYGNAIPKAVLRSAASRAGRRFAGWVFVLAGLSSAALWAFAPLDIAAGAAVTIIAGAVVLAFGYCLLARRMTAAQLTVGRYLLRHELRARADQPAVARVAAAESSIAPRCV
jgi:uncharacterized membrane protein